MGSRYLCRSDTVISQVVSWALPDNIPCVLQEKIQALLDRAQFMPSALSDVDFEVVHLLYAQRQCTPGHNEADFLHAIHIFCQS